MIFYAHSLRRGVTVCAGGKVARWLRHRFVVVCVSNAAKGEKLFYELDHSPGYYRDRARVIFGQFTQGLGITFVRNQRHKFVSPVQRGTTGLQVSSMPAPPRVPDDATLNPGFHHLRQRADAATTSFIRSPSSSSVSPPNPAFFVRDHHQMPPV